jgi:hypothetical protein
MIACKQETTPDELSLQKKDWNIRASDWLSRVLWDGYTLQNLADDVQAGRVLLFHALRCDHLVGCCCVRIDGNCMVVLALGGNFGGPGLDGLIEFSSLIDHLAKRLECDSIRGHMEPDKRGKGLIKAYEKIGFEVSEIVMIKKL